ncbi:MAG: type II toxin-antitoxin system death-on-curing family toxin [Symploca sp. SIO3E6]|nr:type II toxin-antitoxin system death-on-curing family toxin [Caldora sp. SIO3E6]
MQMPKFVEKDVVIAIHEYLINEFGGKSGILDEGLLESALAQPQQTFFGELLHPTIATQASAYLYHLAKNHAFEDGNKRTALGVTETFIRLNGYNLDLSNEELFELTVKVAKGELEKVEIAKVLGAKLVRVSS